MEVLNNTKIRMEKSLEALKSDLTKIRTGRAQPDILSHVLVDYYGTMTPLSQVSNIKVFDSRTLIITPWEKNILSNIEKAILSSKLNIIPINLGDNIKIPIPELNEERRKELVKLVKAESEKSKIAIRNIRRDANSEIKNMLKNKDISEDSAIKMEGNIQKETNNVISKIEQISKNKEKDIMII